MCFMLKRWTVVQSAKTDNIVFKLYYRYTVGILLLFCFVITCRLFVGYSFVCSTDYSTDKMATAYCYSHGLFIDMTVISKNASKGKIHPGIPIGSPPLYNRVHVPYYPWVNLFLLVLAILFYLPHLVWKIFEGGLVTRLTSKVNNSSVSETERKAAIIEIAKYIITTRGGHLSYTVVYVLSEVLNWLVGILLTVWLVNFFNIDMYHSSYEFKMKTWDDFFAYNFPLMGKCEYRKCGSSGVIQIHSTVCYLALNNLYGYMFLFLYAWFILLCVLQGLVIPYHLIVLLLPSIRLPMFRLRSGVRDQTLLNDINFIFSPCDWFLLTRLQKNLLSTDLTKLLFYVQSNFTKTHLDLEMHDLSKLI